MRDLIKFPRILLVDDESGIRAAFATLFQGQFDVTEASNGAEALAKLAVEEIDLVLLDIQMPLMGGRQALALMLSLYPQTKVILVSAGQPIDMEECQKLGAFAWLPKPPWDLTSIREVIERTLAHPAEGFQSRLGRLERLDRLALKKEEGLVRA